MVAARILRNDRNDAGGIDIDIDIHPLKNISRQRFNRKMSMEFTPGCVLANSTGRQP
jgi:hypothetical protein